VSEATQFLYTGANPIQTGVAPATIDPKRAAVLRGVVLTHDSQPLPGVTVTILNHPEFGQTLTRDNGVFDLAVNGGGQLTVSYSLTGFLPAQRQIYAPWQDFAILPDVVLIPLDAQVTAVDLTANMPMQVARGSMMSDADGSRQATVLFPQGTGATMVFPNGSMQPITALSVRATEYTVGANGPNAMPAELPATSGYTYAVELSIDQAMAAGAAEVRFSAPLPFYVENFLGFPIGIDVPVGSYDRTRGVWIPENNGKVIKILSVTSGMADVDTNGDGLADSAATLAALSITDAERQQLATLYAPGQSLWRALIAHFSPHDLNWPPSPPDDAILPPDDPEPDDPLDEACELAGNSVIECQNQILGESIGVVGTGFGLHYQSDRTRGYLAAYTLEIPLSGASLPASILGIELEIEVAGRRFERTFPTITNQRTTFTWDGKDAYGRTLEGPQPITVNISYVYPAVYSRTSRFAAPASGAVTVVPSRLQLKLTRIAPMFIGTFHAPSAGLGGWTLSPHHADVPNTMVLFRGDGQRESASERVSVGPIITRVAGTGTGGGIFSGDGGPATQAQVAPQGIAIGDDGSLYIASPFPQRVRRVDPSGIITTVAGNGIQCSPATAPCGDGGLATQAQLNNPWAVAVGADNSLFILDNTGFRVRKVDPSGKITTIAGTGVFGFSGDGGPGQVAQIGDSRSLAFGPDSAVYIADSNRIRRVGPDRIITTVAGNGNSCAGAALCGDGGPATQAGIGGAAGVAVGRDGSIYIVDASGSRIRRVTPDGIIRTIAGNGQGGFSADGIPATQAKMNPSAVAVGADDTVYIADPVSNRIRWLRPGGPINTLAGPGVAGSPNGDGGPARRATVSDLDNGLAVGPDGSVYLSHLNFRVVRRVTSIAERFIAGELVIPAVDGSEIFIFTPSGQHLRTLDALTGAIRYQFTYDAAGQLATITDRSGNVTTVERDAMALPTGILGPFGQRTTLDLDTNGHLSQVTNPAGEAVQLGYTPSGLLTNLMQPGGQTSSYGYDAIGRLTSATDPTGAVKTLTRSGTNKDHTITLTTALGRVSTFRAARSSNGDVRLTNTDTAGAQSQLLIGLNGTRSSTDSDGTTMNLTLGPDPRWGMRAPIPATFTIRTPNGLTRTTTATQSVTLASPGDLLNLSTLTETLATNGRSFTTTFNGATRTLTQISPTGLQESIALDNQGWPVQAQFGNLAPRTYAYDARGRLASVTDGQTPSSRVTTFGYGVDGFLASMVDPSLRTTTFTTDANGRVIEETLPGGQIVGYTYDANSNLSTLTPPGRPPHVLGYTPRDEISSYTPPLVGAQSSEVRYFYDPDRMPDHIDPPGVQSVDFVYDTAGRLSLVDHATGQLTFAYDAANRPISLDTPLISLTPAYDGGLITGTTWTGAVAGSVTHTYDNNFRLATESVNGANAITFQFDNDDRLTSAGGLTLTRNPLNWLITGTRLGNVTDQFGYNGFGEVTSYSAASSGANVYGAQYTRDNLARITQKSETLGGVTDTFNYSYNARGRLSDVRKNGSLTATSTYDANGNRLTGPSGTTTYTYDDQDRVLTMNTGAGPTSYTHTLNGELQSKTAGGQTTTYQYDGPSNLLHVTLPTGTQIDYVIDAQHRRIGKKINGSLVQSFLYADGADGLMPVAELDANNNVVSRFVFSTGINVPAYMTKGGTTYRFIIDHLGSPRLLIDTATGVVAQRMDYDEFGNVTNDTNPGFQPFGFGGGVYDPQTALTHFGAREYDPQTARWITKDPIGFSGGDSNLYEYVLGDPVNAVDPLGLNVLILPLIAETVVRPYLPPPIPKFIEEPRTQFVGRDPGPAPVVECAGPSGPFKAFLGWIARLFRRAPAKPPPPRPSPMYDRLLRDVAEESRAIVDFAKGPAGTKLGGGVRPGQSTGFGRGPRR
jgi:RHS repeat-associated protein